MMYDHKKNAGNIADIWKHDILLQIIRLLKPETYLETHCGYPYYNKGKIHLSSYLKVRLEHQCKMTLCDINPDIAHHILSDMDFNFICVDSWSLLQENPDYDFYFVDPPYDTPLDRVLLDALLADDNFTKPLVAWYPIFDDTDPEFNFVGYPKIEYIFKEGKLCGCGMVFKNIPKETYTKIL